MVYPNVDGSYLEESFNSTLAANSGTWSVLLGMLVAILFIAAVNFSKLKDGLKDNLKKSSKRVSGSADQQLCGCWLWFCNKIPGYFWHYPGFCTGNFL